MDINNVVFFTGNANPQLAKDIVKKLPIRASMGKVKLERFSDGEIGVDIEESVRGATAFIIQPTCAPTNDHLMELMIMADALKRSSVERLIAVIPYYGYARQDRRPGHVRSAITSKVVANMLATVGFSQIITVDIHSEQQQGFFECPFNNIFASSVFLNNVSKHYTKKEFKDLIVVSPDIGGVSRSRNFAQRLSLDIGIIDKRRPKANQSEVMNIIGAVEGKHCILFDDMVDTAGTLCKAAAALKERGALSVAAYCTHPVLSGKAYDNIEESELNRLVVTDTIPLSDNAPDKIEVVSVAELLAKAISRMIMNGSLGALDES